MKYTDYAKFLSCFFLFFLLASCGSKQKENDQRVLRANALLTHDRCDQALMELAQVDEDYKDYYFYQVQSSAYACRAGYSDLNFFSELDTFDAQKFFNSLAKLKSSKVRSANAAGFVELEKAINVILNSPGVNSSKTTKRQSFFGKEKGDDLSFQALLMILTYMGKWLRYYGSTDATGIKGSIDGEGGKACIINYPNNAVFDHLLDSTRSDSCNSTNGSSAGHRDLDTATSGVTTLVRNQRLCHFLVYFNHLLDILTHISLSSNSSLGEMSQFSAILNDILDAAISGYSFSQLLKIYSIEACTDFAGTDAAHQTVLEGFFAALVESEFK